MPVIRSMFNKMKTEYGGAKGKQVYYATENKLKKQGKLRSMLQAATKHHDLTEKA